MFFRPKPNVSNNSKAKIEYYFERVAQAIGDQRLKNSTVPLATFVKSVQSDEPIERVTSFFSKHLGTQGNSPRVVCRPEPIQKCGSGG